MTMHVVFRLRMGTERTALLRALARAASDGDAEFVVEALAVDVLPMDKPKATSLDDPICEDGSFQEMPDYDK